MSEPVEPAPILVVRGRYSISLGGAVTFAAALGIGTMFGTALLLNLASDSGSLPWFFNSRIGELRHWLSPGVDGFAGLGAGLAVGWVVSRYLERRAGEVALREAGIQWLEQVYESDTPVPWAQFEGFRDTPHPWVEVLRTNGAVRTIPVRAEPERDRLLETLARFLPNLGMPADERQRPV